MAPTGHLVRAAPLDAAPRSHARARRPGCPACRSRGRRRRERPGTGRRRSTPAGHRSGLCARSGRTDRARRPCCHRRAGPPPRPRRGRSQGSTSKRCTTRTSNNWTARSIGSWNATGTSCSMTGPRSAFDSASSAGNSLPNGNSPPRSARIRPTSAQCSRTSTSSSPTRSPRPISRWTPHLLRPRATIASRWQRWVRYWSTRATAARRCSTASSTRPRTRRPRSSSRTLGSTSRSNDSPTCSPPTRLQSSVR